MSEAEKYQEARDNPDKSINNPENKEIKEKNEQDKLDKVSLEILNNAEKISPESKGKLNLVSLVLNEEVGEINKDFQSGKITSEEKEKQLQETYEKFTEDVNAVIGTTEASQAKQNKEFGEKTTADITDYKKDLTKFLEGLVKINQDNSTKKRVDIHQNNQEKEVHGKKQAPEALKEGIKEIFPGEPAKS
ncbi:hypothetical protein M0P65_06355 [Candidatus Gracilibacteria bacterium]|nr:hypothetical protein [Candidatus Gracilibacteria bacterium]